MSLHGVTGSRIKLDEVEWSYKKLDKVRQSFMKLHEVKDEIEESLNKSEESTRSRFSCLMSLFQVFPAKWVVNYNWVNILMLDDVHVLWLIEA